MADVPLSRDQLIAIRDGNRRNADIRALLLEIKRQHRVLMRVESNLAAIDRAFKEEAGGELAALHQLRILQQEEKDRFEDR